MMKNPSSLPAMPRPLWWLTFAGSSVALSWVFQTFKVFTITPDWPNGLLLLGALALVLIFLVILSFDSYVIEKAKGNIHNPVRLFEWIYQLRVSRISPTMDAGGNPSL